MPDGRILVADRENDRIQVFSSSGDYEKQWTDIQRPTQVAVDTQRELIIVSELGWLPGHYSFRHGVMEDRPGRVSVLDFGGDVLVRWGSGDRCAPGSFVAPHGIATDSNGDIYVAEVAWTFAGSHGLAPSDCHTLQKFTPRK
jgi:DNA-binding beta-propeller fold protein YncE